MELIDGLDLLKTPLLAEMQESDLDTCDDSIDTPRFLHLDSTFDPRILDPLSPELEPTSSLIRRLETRRSLRESSIFADVRRREEAEKEQLRRQIERTEAREQSLAEVAACCQDCCKCFVECSGEAVGGIIWCCGVTWSCQCVGSIVSWGSRVVLSVLLLLALGLSASSFLLVSLSSPSIFFYEVEIGDRNEVNLYNAHYFAASSLVVCCVVVVLSLLSDGLLRVFWKERLKPLGASALFVYISSTISFIALFVLLPASSTSMFDGYGFWRQTPWVISSFVTMAVGNALLVVFAGGGRGLFRNLFGGFGLLEHLSFFVPWVLSWVLGTERIGWSDRGWCLYLQISVLSVLLFEGCCVVRFFLRHSAPYNRYCISGLVPERYSWDDCQQNTCSEIWTDLGALFCSPCPVLIVGVPLARKIFSRVCNEGDRWCSPRGGVEILVFAVLGVKLALSVGLILNIVGIRVTFFVVGVALLSLLLPLGAVAIVKWMASPDTFDEYESKCFSFDLVSDGRAFFGGYLCSGKMDPWDLTWDDWKRDMDLQDTRLF